LLDIAADSDPRPLSTAEIEAEMKRVIESGGYRNGPEPPGLRRQAERFLRVQRIVAEFARGAHKVTDTDVENFFIANREQFRRPETFHAAHILCSVNETQTEEQALAKIQIAAAELEKGEDFGSVARCHSSCTGNGDLGVFPAGTMVEEFEQALRELVPGQRTGIFTTPFGYHIAELRARNAGTQAQFEDVRPDIERVLTAMREHEAVVQAVSRLRSRAKIERVSESSEQAV
jgi:peptidyl-prolyl cis-trans isomerase C